jgi:predicted benzoate:H+ symporter BenE
MPGNISMVLLTVGFIVGAAPIVMLGVSLLEDHERRLVLPATIASALVCGALVAFSLNYFFHFANSSGQ